MTKSIQSLFAYIATDAAGNPFIPVLREEQSGAQLPMFFVSRESADSMRNEAQMVADRLKSPVVLAEFTTRTDLETIRPANQPN